MKRDSNHNTGSIYSSSGVVTSVTIRLFPEKLEHWVLLTDIKGSHSVVYSIVTSQFADK